MNALLSTAYWPNLQYFFYILNATSAQVEQFEHYGKQSFRNRCQLLTANGVLDLSIPVKKRAIKELVNEVEISYQENWQIKHWRAITSAYKNSPYFDYFEEEIKPFYFNHYSTLLEYNLNQVQTILKILKQKREITLTRHYNSEAENVLDLREKIHPKIPFKEDSITVDILARPYYQTFENKFEFQPNLSILDLLFNTGLGCNEYLKGS